MAENTPTTDFCAIELDKDKKLQLDIAASNIGGVAAQINLAIAEIEKISSWDGLQTAVGFVSGEIDSLLEGINDQIAQIASKFLPLLKVPGSVQKLLGAFKKLILGTIAPQVKAYVELTQQLIEIAQLSRRLIQAIGEVLPRLQQGAIDAINEEIYGLQSELNTRINVVVLSLSNNINKQLCEIGPTLADLGEQLNDAVVSTEQLLVTGRSIADQAEASVATTLNTISTIGSSLQQLAPITFNIDTSSAEAFNQSIGAGAFDEFQQSVDDFVNLVLPTNTSPPTVTGTVQLGETLTVSTGTWEGDPSFSYQWYRNQVPIVGANQATYILGAADGNQSVITVEVTGTNQNGDDIAQPAPITTTYVTGGLFSFGQRV